MTRPQECPGGGVCTENCGDRPCVYEYRKPRATDARLFPNYPGQHGEHASGSREAGITARVDGHSQATGTRPRCNYCGYLGWTVEYYGRVTHKESCPQRTDPWSQTYPQFGRALRAEHEQRSTRE